MVRIYVISLVTKYASVTFRAKRDIKKCCHEEILSAILETGECLLSRSGRLATAMHAFKQFYAKCLGPFVSLSVPEAKQQTNTSTGLRNTSG